MHPLTIVLYFLCCVALGFIGRKYRFGFWGYFFASLMFSPVIGSFLLISAIPAQKQEERAEEMRTKSFLRGFILLFSSALFTFSAYTDAAALELKANGQKYRVATVQTGDYWSFDLILTQIKKNMVNYNYDDFIEFPEELFFTFDWQTDQYNKGIEKLLARTDYDAILTFGTATTLLLLKHSTGNTPIIAISTTAPVKSGILQSFQDSGRDNLTAAVNEDVTAYMFRAFHQLGRFKRLGIMYVDTPQGHVYAYREEAVQAARDLGFELVEYPFLSTQETFAECMKGVQVLIQQNIDAFFVSSLNCFDIKFTDPTPMYDLLEQHKISTYAADDREQVRNFALMGLTLFDGNDLARFHLDQLVKIFEGVPPRSLNMIVPYNYLLMFNLETASKLGIDFDPLVLTTADEIFLKQNRLAPGEQGHKTLKTISPAISGDK